jgi:hypothetical protein
MSRPDFGLHMTDAHKYTGRGVARGGVWGVTPPPPPFIIDSANVC